MVFLFNQTGEELKLRCDVVESANGASKMNIAVVFPDQSYVNLLHTKSAAIIKAAKDRFRVGLADFQPNHAIGHDFYIPKKLTGYDITNVSDGAMVNMIPCDVNPSVDREVIRNLAVAVFKKDESKNPSLQTYDTNDTSATKIEGVTFCEKTEASMYEFHFVAIKWVGWFRLKRPSYLIVDDGEKKFYYMLSSIESKMKANIKNDWLLPLSDDEAEMMIAAAKVEESKRASVEHVKGVAKPQGKNQGNRRPNQNRNNYRKGSGDNQNRGKSNGYKNNGSHGQNRNNQQRSGSNGNYRSDGNRSNNGGYQKRNNNSSYYKKKRDY